MSRSGYSDDYDGDNWDLIRWRGAVTSAIRGKRGQAFLREALAALDAMPEKQLIAGDLVAFNYDPLTRYLFAPVVQDPEDPWRNWEYEHRWRDAFDDRKEAGVCLLGAVGQARGVPMAGVDPENREGVAALFGLPHALACEIMWENDDAGRHDETPRARWERMRKWIVHHLRDDQPVQAEPSEAATTVQPIRDEQGLNTNGGGDGE